MVHFSIKTQLRDMNNKNIKFNLTLVEVSNQVLNYVYFTTLLTTQVEIFTTSIHNLNVNCYI